MLPIEKMGLSANQWQFLQPESVDKYIAASTERILAPESTKRQFTTARDILERLNGSNGEPARRGILLADDVGLGKTTVAALVAWVVASAGERRGVRILAPNDVMMRRWEEELLSHVVPLQKCAPALDVRGNRVKARRVGRLSAGTIQVVKHSYASSDFNLACDLLIVDEAHRAKGDKTAFSTALKRQRKHARRVLILTATPFSIRLEELKRMLELIGGESARAPVAAFSNALDNLYAGNTARNPEMVANRLADKAKAAVDALSEYVIRHGIDDLPEEHNDFGGRDDWQIDVPPAESKELELMLRMDRALRIEKKANNQGKAKITNDPRFHVGWQHFDAEAKKLKQEAQCLPELGRAVVDKHLQEMKILRRETGAHSKMVAVAKAVNKVIEQGEKVVLFCHHHATAQELTAHLYEVSPKVAAPKTIVKSVWERAWHKVLPVTANNNGWDSVDQFIEWLCNDLNRMLMANWLHAEQSSVTELMSELQNKPANRFGSKKSEIIVIAARRLYDALMKSKSSRAVLKEAADRPELLPGAILLPGVMGSRVLGVCEPSGKEEEENLFVHNRQPDTVISIFNSPFGPDVLVVTDKLSEGIDLHRYCRHLIHYELDPSPIRTVQRNGRVRRVNSWAAVTGQPIQYAYPAFRGTRDHRLVQIMKKRIDSFSLLLGGVQDFDVEEVVGSDEKWRNEVISIAKDRLAKIGGKLCAKK